MKELSIEEKAKAYDEAIERAKEQLNGAKVFDYDNEQIAHDIRTTVYNIFPEFKESEDEKVEKAIFGMVYDSDNELWSSYDVSKSEVLDWLEKQGGQKPVISYDALREGIAHFGITQYQIDNWLKKYVGVEKQGEQKQDPCEHCDNVMLNCQNFPCIKKRAFEQGKSVFEISDENPTIEPKFKVGDWITNGIDVYNIKNIDLKEINYTFENGSSSDITLTDNTCHLWTIQDARDGDVLQLGKVTTIFKEFIGNGNCRCYCSVCDGEFEIPSKDGADNSYGCHNAVPATKEQRDTLEKAMDDAGFTFDFEKKELKELKKIKQTPANKVEPKFKVGDWIIRSAEGLKHNAYLVKEVKDYYVCEDLKGRRITFTFSDVHKNFKLWDISDAKDGDVLVHSSFIFIYNNTSILQAYCYYSRNRFIIEDRGHHCPWNMQEVTPATKEQRDILMKAMAHARYTFDFEKKELKKIEKNPAWSEEDEKIRLDLIQYFVNGNDLEHNLAYIFDWLKSLKDRVGCEDYTTTKKWSEEDERTYKGLINLIYATQYCDSRKEFSDWLKSLKDRYSWKPNDKQMRNLEYACNSPHEIDTQNIKILKSLYEDLKKLMGNNEDFE